MRALVLLCFLCSVGGLAGCAPPEPPAAGPAETRYGEVFRGAEGDWYWRLRDARHQIRDNSAGYQTRAAAERGFRTKYPALPIR